MSLPKEELIDKIEQARTKLNLSIDTRESYDIIYKYSVELDLLIEEYMTAGY